MDRLALYGGEPVLSNLKPELAAIPASVRAAAHQCIDSSEYDWSYASSVAGGGPVEELEKKMAAFLCSKHVLAMSSCTGALHISLLACGVKSGDEVIVPSYSWGQSVGPVLHIGATPMFSDIDPDSYTVSRKTIQPLLSEKTRAIIVTNLFGHPADVRSIRESIKGRDIVIIEDCAQSLGAQFDGFPIGSFSDIACFSFGRGKAVQAGEGGAFATNNPNYYEKAVWLSQHPIRQRYELSGRLRSGVGEFSFNYRIHPVAAAMASEDLDALPERLTRAQRFYTALTGLLGNTNGIRPVSVSPRCEHACYLYSPTFRSTIKDKSGRSILRQLYVQALVAEGIPIYEDPVGTVLHRRIGFRRMMHYLGTTVKTKKQHPCRNAVARCSRIGVSFAPWLPLVENENLISGLDEAFSKVEEWLSSGRI